MKPFRYYNPTDLIFGCEKFSELGQIINKMGKKKALIMCTPRRRYIKDAQNYLEEFNIEILVFDKVIPNPSVKHADEAGKLAQDKHIDIIIGIGGGSVIDSAKAAAVVAGLGGSAWDYLFFSKKQPTGDTLPIIAIPTTSGTGSHMTPYSVINDYEKKEKFAIANQNCIPKLSICDPKLMLSVPKRITIETGFDVFSHAFESYTNLNASPMSDNISLEAMKIIAKTLLPLTEDLKNIELREKMALADTYAGMAILNAGTTIPHSMGQPISALHHNIAHGLSLMLVYPPILKFSAKNAPEKFIKVGKLFDNSVNTVEDSISVISSWIKSFGLETKLSEIGIKSEDLDELLRQCMIFPDYQFGPRLPTKDDIRKFYQDVL